MRPNLTAKTHKKEGQKIYEKSSKDAAKGWEGGCKNRHLVSNNAQPILKHYVADSVHYIPDQTLSNTQIQIIPII